METTIQGCMPTVTDSTEEVVTQLHLVCHATVTLVDGDGQIVHAIGGTPLHAVYQAISDSPKRSQVVDIDGWRGVMSAVQTGHEHGLGCGWLIVLCRRADFPAADHVSAVDDAATRIAAHLQTAPWPHLRQGTAHAAIVNDVFNADADMTRRLSTFGISLDKELRAVLVEIRAPAPTNEKREVMREAAFELDRRFKQATIDAVLSVRDESIAILAHADVDVLRRLCGHDGARLGISAIGIGRDAHTAADVRRSYADADVALRVLSTQCANSGTRELRVLSYEDFSYPLRFIADAGFGHMSAWSATFLSPLRGRAQILEALTSYVAHHQNISATARSLFIHQNSLRYRLARAESILRMNLKDPADISAVCLALAAQQISDNADWRCRPDIEAAAPRPADPRPYPAPLAAD